MLTGDVRLILESLSLEGHPGNAHLPHVLLARRPCSLGLESGQLRHLLAGQGPVQSGKGEARVVGSFGILHHLPKAFQAGVALAVEGEWGCGKIGQQAKLVALGEDYFAGARLLWQDFPRRRAFLGYHRPPMAWIMRIMLTGLRWVEFLVWRMTASEDQEQERCKATAHLSVMASFGAAFKRRGMGPQTLDFRLETPDSRSEERRVGKDCRSRWLPY